MHTTRHFHVKLSRLLCYQGEDATPTCALLRRWQEMHSAPPVSATGPATALLAETVEHLEASAPKIKTGASPSAEVPHNSTTLFLSPRHSQLIWSVVQRHRVPWREALRLLPWQLQTMSVAQRVFVEQGIATTPWLVACIVRSACEVARDDVALVQHYRKLEGATHMVEFARLVSAALRERPSLPGGFLPVPYRVVRHGYQLGLRSPQEAAMALEISKHLTLVGRSALSRVAEEHLTLAHASLEGCVGNWAAGLMVVTQSRAVRLSVRRGIENYVRSLQGKGTEHAAVSGHGEMAGEHTRRPEWSSGSTNQSNSTAILSSAFLPTSIGESTKAQRGAAWLSALNTFLAKPPERQTYAEARVVLAALPTDRTQQPDYVVLATVVLTHAARRMYSGTLTRRLVSGLKKAEWGFVLSLASAARHYDVAVPLLPFVPPATTLPADLREFLGTLQSIKGTVSSSTFSSPTSSSQQLTRAAVETLSYPQALAYALEGDASTRQLLLLYCPQSQSLSRLRSLLLAARQHVNAATVGADRVTTTSEVKQDEEEGDTEGNYTDIECCTFQSSLLSQLVCGAATEQRQRYFYKVVPASMRAHHFRLSPFNKAPLKPSADIPGEVSANVSKSNNSVVGNIDAVTSCHDVLQRWRQQTATTPAACTGLLSDFAAFLRATYAVEGVATAVGPHAKPRLTEEVFLRGVATLTAWGAIQLPATERFHWPLAVLKVACLLRVTLDATLVSAAIRTVPSIFVDNAVLALPGILTAQTLLGNWKEALQVCARLQRKEREGLIRLKTPGDGLQRPQTCKYKAPPPSLEEAMAQVGYGVPAPVAVKHWSALDSLSTSSARELANASSFPLMLIELRQLKDVRQLCEELRRNGTPTSRHVRLNAQLERLSRRRMLFGAAFALLEDEAALQCVVHAGGQRQVRAGDVDSHGLQRLLSVLPATTVSSVLTEEAAAGRCAQEHWLLSCVSHPDVMTTNGEVRGLTRLRPTSAVLSAVSCFHTALECKSPVLCIKSLKRLVDVTFESPARRTSLMSLARLLRCFLSDDDLIRACVRLPSCSESTADTTNSAIATAALQQAQLLFNRLQEVEQLSGPLKQARRLVRRTIDPPVIEAPLEFSLPTPHATPCATWVILFALQTAISRTLHLPIPASFASHLFLRSATGTSDWRAALFFFNQLRHPTNNERVALVWALRPCGGAATSLLLSHRRFMRHLPEQLMLWADESSGPLKWEYSIELFAQTQMSTSVSGGNSNDGGGDAGSAEQRRVVEIEEGGDALFEEVPPISTVVLSPHVRAAVAKWNADECFRAAQLLRRQGFVKIPSKPERSLAKVQVMEADPHARRQVEAILELLKKRTASAAAAAPTVPTSPKARLARKTDPARKASGCVMVSGGGSLGA